MAIRPVEVQGVVQRSQDIGQIKQNQDQKPQTDQTNIHVHMQHQTQQKSKQVTKFDNADKKEEKYDAKEKGKGEFFNNGKKGKQKQMDEEEDGVVKVKSTHSSFDVKI